MTDSCHWCYSLRRALKQGEFSFRCVILLLRKQKAICQGEHVLEVTIEQFHRDKILCNMFLLDESSLAYVSIVQLSFC
jgi:hypothetical protein